jgi:AraC-like DNA-binding protein
MKIKKIISMPPLFKSGVCTDDLIWRYYSSTFEQGWRMDNPHRHNAVEFLYAVQGSCRLGLTGKSVNLAKNDFLVISSGAWHDCEVKNTIGCTLINIHLLLKDNINQEFINQDFCEGFFRMILSEESFIRFNSFISLFPLMKLIASELEARKPGFELIVMNEIENLMILLARRFSENSDLTLHAGCPERVQKAVSFIEDSISMELSVSLIARALNISPDRLMHLFSEEMNVPLMEYVRRKKIEHAGTLLSDTDMKIIDIAVETGFRNPQHFSTVFKKYSNDVTPKQFRLRARQLNNDDKNIFR